METKSRYAALTRKQQGFRFTTTDSPVLMAAKSHLRINKPVILAIATNDAIGANFENIGRLLNTKNIYFVPFGQDDYINKPKSMVAQFDKIPDTILECVNGRQIQPVII